jgi:hypothetical protein
MGRHVLASLGGAVTAWLAVLLLAATVQVGRADALRASLVVRWHSKRGISVLASVFTSRQGCERECCTRQG